VGFVAACSVRRLDPRISGNRRISSRLQRGSSSPVSPLHGFQPSSSFFSLLPAQPLSLSPPAPCTCPPCPCARPPFPCLWRSGDDRPWRPTCLGLGNPRRRPRSVGRPPPPPPPRRRQKRLHLKFFTKNFEIVLNSSCTGANWFN
jgi:hypothetical protein